MAKRKAYEDNFDHLAEGFANDESFGERIDSNVPALSKKGEPPHNGDMEARLAALESAVKELPTKVDFAELRADMSEGREAVHKLLLENSRWTHTALVSMLSVAVIGILGLLFTIWNATKSSVSNQPAVVQPSQQPPIIINVPTSPGPASKE